MRETELERQNRMLSCDLSIFDGKGLGGVDEAGRGPLAGNVMAACVVLDPGNIPLGINDSKKLSESKREALFPQILESAVSWGIGECTVEEIEELNIKQAARLAMCRAIEKAAPDFVLVDAEKDLPVPVPQKALIHGDALSLSIAAASILAKVTRDRQMAELDKLYPQYGFARHKGYGTREHIEMLRKYGPCPAHRALFIRNFL
ncbi:MAG: ribonuclease HII [Clostridia bacterium]|nr:ribonuclease HII [Clostridia bacterium]